MAICDVCNASAGANSETYTPGQFVSAVMSGFRPSEETLTQLAAMQGISTSVVEALWFQNAIKSPTNWLLCANCASRVSRHSSATKTTNPSEKQCCRCRY